MNNTHWKGDKAEYTGKEEVKHGATFYFIKLIEGHRKGETVVTIKPPTKSKPSPILPILTHQALNTTPNT